MRAPVTGGCLCGGVRFEVDREQLRGVVVCHCSLCRRWGTLAGAFTWAASDAVTVTADETLATYVDVNGRERRFCAACGSSLFWVPAGGDGMSISAGSLDDLHGMETLRHIHVDSAAAWEEIPTALPRHPQGSSSPPLPRE